MHACASPLSVTPPSPPSASLIASLLQKSTLVHCHQCNTPAGAIVGGALVIKHRHHGEQHTTVLNLIALASALFFGDMNVT